MDIGSIGAEGQPKRRHRVSVTTREKVTWPEGSRPEEVWVLVLDTNTVATDADAALAICWDAQNDAQADTWLDVTTDAEDTDVEFDLIPIGQWTGPFYHKKDIADDGSYDGLTRADFKAIGAETLRVLIRGN